MNGVLVPRKHEMIENDLIKSFKFLNLNANDFKYFLRNKKLRKNKKKDDFLRKTDF